MGKRGLEPLRLAAHDPKSCPSASSGTSPDRKLELFHDFVNKKQTELLTKFLSSRRQGLSPHTIAFYQNCLKTPVEAYELTPKGIHELLANLNSNAGGKLA